MSSFLSLYNGFSIDSDTGNNSFSFSRRKNKSIFVPPLIKGSLSDLQEGKHISFSEMVEDQELNFYGLKHFLHWSYSNKDIFIFDNHNHAFFFWAYAVNKNIIGFNETLVHIDQHSDMRVPKNLLKKREFHDLQRVFQYTNFELNVGNFIQPAYKIGLFKDVEIIDSSYAFDKEISGPVVLDIDMDIFSDDMHYIANPLKIEKIRKYLSQAKFVTIATSPFFIDQRIAIEKINEIFSAS